MVEWFLSCLSSSVLHVFHLSQFCMKALLHFLLCSEISVSHSYGPSCSLYLIISHNALYQRRCLCWQAAMTVPLISAGGLRGGGVQVSSRQRPEDEDRATHLLLLTASHDPPPQNPFIPQPALCAGPVHSYTCSPSSRVLSLFHCC